MAETIVKETTVEIEEPEAKTEAKAPTRDDLKSKGWGAKELEAAEKRGMIANPDGPDAQKKAAEETKVKAETEAKAKAEETAKNAEKAPEKKPGERFRKPVPEFTFKTPEQEKAFIDAFGPGTEQRAMYFRMKTERASRQAAEQKAQAAEQRAQALEARIKALESGKPAEEVDDDGNVIDPEEKPLTIKQLREMQKAEADEQKKKESEFNERARIVADAQTTQEEYARSVYSDFDETVEKAKAVIQNLDLLPESWQKSKAVKLIRDLQVAAAHADKLGPDDYHAALIAYEIGQMHPDYVKPTNGDNADKDGKLKDPSKANGSLTPEQMKRIEENNQRRASSASVSGGGGKRTISVDDVDLATLNKMNYAERNKFREKHPDRYAKLLRG
jgi:hypothetical protein